MSRNNLTTHEVQWEISEHGWHAVVALCNKGYQWTAYIEYDGAPHWRVWAGCMFSTIVQAQEWCKAEIFHQIRSSQEETSAKHNSTPSEVGAWHWLWNKLSHELGQTQASALCDEMKRRLDIEELTYVQNARFVGQNLISSGG